MGRRSANSGGSFARRALKALCLCALAFGCTRQKLSDDRCRHVEAAPVRLESPLSRLKTVFVIVLENANWSDIRGNPSLPYLNKLVGEGAHEEQYFNPMGVHPSEPNYLWMEGGTDYGVRDDQDPAAHHFENHDHLVSLLGRAGVSWRSYQEGIGAQECPLQSHGLYAVKHNPFVFFEDVSGDAAFCIAHERPLAELEHDLLAGSVARYNFITPDLCHDMHGAHGCPRNLQEVGETWLSTWVPRIQASKAYRDAGVLFITWDEGEGRDGPIGMIALSPLAKRGYASTTPLTHSALLRTLQEIFGVGPFLCDAAQSKDLADLFTLP
ncbi:MAG TPA: alkaline phosphatase family protein [Myxococcales bacterium]|jgi:hypothetical protein